MSISQTKQSHPPDGAWLCLRKDLLSSEPLEGAAWAVLTLPDPPGGSGGGSCAVLSFSATAL